MPIYEYQCQDCGHELEKLQKMSDAPLKECPSCEQDTLSKKVSAAGFRLKGTGWYETDFKNKKPKTETNNKNSADKTKPKASTKTE